MPVALDHRSRLQPPPYATGFGAYADGIQTPWVTVSHAQLGQAYRSGTHTCLNYVSGPGCPCSGPCDAACACGCRAAASNANANANATHSEVEAADGAAGKTGESPRQSHADRPAKPATALDSSSGKKRSAKPKSKKSKSKSKSDAVKPGLAAETTPDSLPQQGNIQPQPRSEPAVGAGAVFQRQRSAGLAQRRRVRRGGSKKQPDYSYRPFGGGGGRGSEDSKRRAAVAAARHARVEAMEREDLVPEPYPNRSTGRGRLPRGNYPMPPLPSPEAVAAAHVTTGRGLPRRLLIESTYDTGATPQAATPPAGQPNLPPQLRELDAARSVVSESGSVGVALSEGRPWREEETRECITRRFLVTPDGTRYLVDKRREISGADVSGDDGGDGASASFPGASVATPAGGNGASGQSSVAGSLSTRTGGAANTGPRRALVPALSPVPEDESFVQRTLRRVSPPSPAVPSAPSSVSTATPMLTRRGSVATPRWQRHNHGRAPPASPAPPAASSVQQVVPPLQLGTRAAQSVMAGNRARWAAYRHSVRKAERAKPRFQRMTYAAAAAQPKGTAPPPCDYDQPMPEVQRRRAKVRADAGRANKQLLAQWRQRVGDRLPLPNHEPEVDVPWQF